MNTLLFEEMIRAQNDTHVCRIWRQVHTENSSDLGSFALGVMNDDMLSTYEKVRVIVGNVNVNSVEIIDRETGCGLCVHKDWP